MSKLCIFAGYCKDIRTIGELSKQGEDVKANTRTHQILCNSPLQEKCDLRETYTSYLLNSLFGLPREVAQA